MNPQINSDIHDVCHPNVAGIHGKSCKIIGF